VNKKGAIAGCLATAPLRGTRLKLSSLCPDRINSALALQPFESSFATTSISVRAATRFVRRDGLACAGDDVALIRQIYNGSGMRHAEQQWIEADSTDPGIRTGLAVTPQA
jgi:hypothetical protein